MNTMNCLNKILFCVLLITFYFPFNAQYSIFAQQKTNVVELEPSQFSDTLKVLWYFLKDATDLYLDSTESKTEFETTDEFRERSSTLRNRYINKIERLISSNSLNKKRYAIYLKATLKKYDADNQLYPIGCDEVLEAPYNIPRLQITVPLNRYLELKDSVARGYRQSIIQFISNPILDLDITKENALVLKNNERDIFFRIILVISLDQKRIKRKAYFVMIPESIQLVNRGTKSVIWEDTTK